MTHQRLLARSPLLSTQPSPAKTQTVAHPSPTKQVATQDLVLDSQLGIPPSSFAPSVSTCRPRSALPNELLEARAERDALRRIKREDELAELRKEIAELRGQQLGKDKAECTDPCFLPLKAQFAAVKPKYFRQIFDNEFEPINIIRLCKNVTISRSYSKYIDLGKNVEIQMRDEDATEYDIKGFPVFIRCLGVYFQIMIHLIFDDKTHILSLCVAF